jgi:hypothetical protein
MGAQQDQAAKIFDAAVEFETPAERAAYLDAACGQNPQLRAEVEELLQNDDAAGGFLETPVLALVARVADGSGLNEGRPSSNTEPTAAQVTSPQVEIPAALAEHTRYHVEEVLGVGGMGAVFKAQHRLMHRPVALKVMSPELMDRPAAVERFQREVRAAAQLAHPNIVAAYDADQVGDTHFLVMEFIDGISLARLVAEQGPLPVVRACDYIRQTALGLQHAWERHGPPGHEAA